ncbi:hypothetical protein [Bartonella phoceensis]|uniref:hypothetical protein n=1 Tax=Bartonella phoceensis TaxID=270249 RepID=UPI001ABA2C37|nr:hypothetical protein [Bartonella phoceensis]
MASFTVAPPASSADQKRLPSLQPTVLMNTDKILVAILSYPPLAAICVKFATAKKKLLRHSFRVLLSFSRPSGVSTLTTLRTTGYSPFQNQWLS